MFTSFVGFNDSVTFPFNSFESFSNGLKNPTSGPCSTHDVAKILRGEGGGLKKPRPVGSINSVQTGKHCPLISQVAQDFDFCRHATGSPFQRRPATKPKWASSHQIKVIGSAMASRSISSTVIQRRTGSTEEHR